MGRETGSAAAESSRAPVSPSVLLPARTEAYRSTPGGRIRSVPERRGGAIAGTASGCVGFGPHRRGPTFGGHHLTRGGCIGEGRGIGGAGRDMRRYNFLWGGTTGRSRAWPRGGVGRVRRRWRARGGGSEREGVNGRSETRERLEMGAAIRDGRRPDGSLIGPPMPMELYRGFSDRDVAAMVLYLRSAPAVRNLVVERSTYPSALIPYGPPVTDVPDPPADDPVKRGAYLAGPVTHCLYCHGRIAEQPPGTGHTHGRGRPASSWALGRSGLTQHHFQRRTSALATGPTRKSIAGRR